MRFFFAGWFLAPVVPAVKVHDHEIHLQAHIGIQMGIKKNENVNADADDGDGPVPDIVNGCKPYAQKPGDHARYFEPGLLVPPIMQRVDHMHCPNIEKVLKGTLFDVLY